MVKKMGPMEIIGMNGVGWRSLFELVDDLFPHAPGNGNFLLHKLRF